MGRSTEKGGQLAASRDCTVVKARSTELVVVATFQRKVRGCVREKPVDRVVSGSHTEHLLRGRQAFDPALDVHGVGWELVEPARRKQSGGAAHEDRGRVARGTLPRTLARPHSSPLRASPFARAGLLRMPTSRVSGTALFHVIFAGHATTMLPAPVNQSLKSVVAIV